uniref:SP-RING-type domain-containing protein n=1 Tax=Mucochytrium quahogii TaxID=96639 RepID=A0A7S2RVG8_9STRA|mmetsp:Transcript_8351/g.13528  ORF Transcript_8351/g.13528 Transcript_8351/m.13528 type:complete len:282 (-) Transcript_8351:45-890(-)|eukprot:CAMPEP_0203759150 /NCGR_PEP_ID=MMETSP0098-20131031/12104_1 /ASSEMBLY_ACC=CAM_ASM_000208 /TAXON_ID=96639 /ORGANISM=" , Strain NY0313808BC1" /LENGTH=281 /DNA_ID=CAMNT_0050651931 /DNA_START=66 /DNA_END=911 /DNA_ORIENTATION=+
MLSCEEGGDWGVEEEDAAADLKDELECQRQVLVKDLRRVVQELKDVKKWLVKSGQDLVMNAKMINFTKGSFQVEIQNAAEMGSEIPAKVEGTFDKSVETMHTHFLNICRKVVKQEVRIQALGTVLAKVQEVNMEMEDDLVDISALYEEEMQKVTEAQVTKQVENSELVLLWKEELQVNEEDDDEDIQEVGAQSRVPLKCPITQLDLENPYKCSKCGHYLSKMGVDHLFKKKNSAKCPIGGCMQVSSKSNWVPDKWAAREVERSQRMASLQTQRQMEEGEEL